MNIDGTLLRRVLANLLSNAVKFSRAGSTVSLMLAERDGHAVNMQPGFQAGYQSAAENTGRPRRKLGAAAAQDC